MRVPCGAAHVADRRIDEVEPEDGEHLDPPVDACCRRGAAGRPSAPGLHPGVRHGATCRCFTRFAAARSRRSARRDAHDHERPRTTGARRWRPDRRMHGEPVAEQHERTLAHTETAERDRQRLEHRHRGHERERGRTPRGARARGRSARTTRDDRDLVHDGYDEHLDDPLGIAARPVDTLEHGADEAGPVLVGREPAGDAGMPGREEDQSPTPRP